MWFLWDAEYYCLLQLNQIYFFAAQGWFACESLFTSYQIIDEVIWAICSCCTNWTAFLIFTARSIKIYADFLRKKFSLSWQQSINQTLWHTREINEWSQDCTANQFGPNEMIGWPPVYLPTWVHSACAHMNMCFWEGALEGGLKGEGGIF